MKELNNNSAEVDYIICCGWNPRPGELLPLVKKNVHSKVIAESVGNYFNVTFFYLNFAKSFMRSQLNIMYFNIIITWTNIEVF